MSGFHDKYSHSCGVTEFSFGLQASAQEMKNK